MSNPTNNVSDTRGDLPAGRGLDALVAERVMGWERVGCESNRRHTEYVPHGFDPISAQRRPIPEYSADIRAAWDVVEKIGRASELSWSPAFGERRALAMIGIYDPPGGVAQADTMAHAICLAALKAVGP